jgi:hypothetical protein
LAFANLWKYRSPGVAFRIGFRILSLSKLILLGVQGFLLDVQVFLPEDLDWLC